MRITVKGRLKPTQFEIQGLDSLMATADYDGIELTAQIAGSPGTFARVELSTHEIIAIMRASLPCDPDARARFIKDYLA